MKKSTPESYRHLLIVLFWFFEVLLVAAIVAWICGNHRGQHPLVDEAIGITGPYSFVGLLILCFLFRWSSRDITLHDLALIGWMTLGGAFLSCLLFPVL